MLSYLPLAHIYERLAEQNALWAGAMRIGYFHGEMLELVDDLKLLRPTAFASCPVCIHALAMSSHEYRRSSGFQGRFVSTCRRCQTAT